jgi:hypothetical protein
MSEGRRLILHMSVSLYSDPNRTGTFAQGGRLRMADCGG